MLGLWLIFTKCKYFSMLEFIRLSFKNLKTTIVKFRSFIKRSPFANGMNLTQKSSLWHNKEDLPSLPLSNCWLDLWIWRKVLDISLGIPSCGRHFGFVFFSSTWHSEIRVNKITNSATWVHCNLHQCKICWKGFKRTNSDRYLEN